MTTIQPTTPPPGFRLNSRGGFDPESLIKPIDLERDELVMSIVAKAKVAAGVVSEFRTAAFGDVAAFVEMSAEEYKVLLGGKKGNVSLTSYDGRYQVKRAIQEKMVFDERLQAAKALIESCLRRWTDGSSPEVQVIVNDAFQVDREGNINTARVLGLRRLAIKDEEWQRGMTAIGDALQFAGSKSYIRVYERDANGEYKAINLDMAGA